MFERTAIPYAYYEESAGKSQGPRKDSVAADEFADGRTADGLVQSPLCTLTEQTALA